LPVAETMRLRMLCTLCVVLGAGTLSTADADVFAEAEWETVGTVPGAEPVVALADGALFTGVDVPVKLDLDGDGDIDYDGFAPFGTYLFHPESGLTRVADSPGPLNRHFAAAFDEGWRVLVGGGILTLPPAQGGWQVVDECFVYDVANERWSRAPRIPAETFNIYTNIAASLPDGRVIVTGGSTSDDEYYRHPDEGWAMFLSSRNVWIFDPDGWTFEDGALLPGSWSKGQPMPATRVLATHAPGDGFAIELGLGQQGVAVGRSMHDTIVLPGNPANPANPGDRVLLIGGRATQPAEYYGTANVDIYDVAHDSWQSLAPMPAVQDDGDQGYGGRAFAGVALLGSGEVMVAGGTSFNVREVVDPAGDVAFVTEGTFTRRSSLLLDPVNDTWRRVGDLNVPRSGALAVAWPEVDRTYAIAVGGIGPLTSGVLTGVRPSPSPVVIGASPHGPWPPPPEAYDSSTESWSVLPTEPVVQFDDPFRVGALLSDGTVLTKTRDAPTVTRLHPAGSH
jgi:hypothetical protein